MTVDICVQHGGREAVRVCQWQWRLVLYSNVAVPVVDVVVIGSVVVAHDVVVGSETTTFIPRTTTTTTTTTVPNRI